ncbi:MAG: CCA tRNA nucleotidyltransferase [Anaerolineae bacterium]|nr:MAG: CCA tRNA nucleotidyltransferase [Anaerolineae bacterium]
MVDSSEEQLIDPDLLEGLRTIFASYGEDIYLVGGAVRDLFLKRTIHDLDFAVARRAIKFTFLVADKLGYPAYVLDQERDAARVVIPPRGITIDFAALRGQTLEEDLYLRDFTINSMALPALEIDKSKVIDLFGGLEDLEQKIIRPTNDKVISSDPLRALRAVRLAVELDFSLSPDTEEIIQLHRVLMSRVSGERIKDELVRILNSPRPAEGLEYLGCLGLYPFFNLGMKSGPEIRGGDQTELNGVLRTATLFTFLEKLNALITRGRRLDDEDLRITFDILEEFTAELDQYFNREIDGGFNGWTLLKLGALFACINDIPELVAAGNTQTGKDSAEKGIDSVSTFVIDQLTALRLSRAAQRYILAVVAGSHRPLFMVNNKLNSRREIYRFFNKSYPAGLDIAWLSIASALAKQIDLTNSQEYSELLSMVRTLFDSYFRHYDKIVEPVHFINGTDIMAELGLQSGPVIGRLLDHIEEEQAAGEVENKDQALTLARQLLDEFT